jgi:hypothetical protein
MKNGTDSGEKRKSDHSLYGTAAEDVITNAFKRFETRESGTA